jgi:hypothetical protein
LGNGKRALAAVAIVARIEPPRLSHYRGELRFQSVFRFFHRSNRRLVIVLRSDRLGRHQSRKGISGGLTDCCFELGDIGAAGTGLGKRRSEAEHRAKNQTGCNLALTKQFVPSSSPCGLSLSDLRILHLKLIECNSNLSDVSLTLLRDGRAGVVRWK